MTGLSSATITRDAGVLNVQATGGAGTPHSAESASHGARTHF